MDPRILIVDDAQDLVELVCCWLNHAGYHNLESVYTGNDALAAAQRQAPDCILLDLVLPDQSGLEVCQKIRAHPQLSRVPVILFTGHKREKVLGLQNGADYFVGKSSDPGELLATLDAVFKRRQMEQGLLTRGGLSLRAQDRQVHWRGQLVATLTPKMFVLLHVLVERYPEPVSRADLFRLVGGVEEAGPSGPSRALDVMLNRLRKCLPPDLSSSIANVKNFGYVFVPTPSPVTDDKKAA